MLLLLAALVPLVWSIQPASAQTDSQIVEELEPLLDTAREKGLSVIVVSPSDDDKPEQTGPSMGDQALKVRSELFRILTKAPDLWSSIIKTLTRVSPDGTFTWLGIAVLTAIGGILVGTGPTILIRNWNRKYFSGLFNPEPQSRAEKITYLMLRALLILLNVSAMFLIAVTIAVSIRHRSWSKQGNYRRHRHRIHCVPYFQACNFLQHHRTGCSFPQDDQSGR